MTAPTQAQIEAAAKAIAKEVLSITKENGITIFRTERIATAALAAAAEVGDEYSQGFRHGFAGYEEAIAATIERCARAAETQHLSSTKYADNPYEDIAAAIRAMKEEKK